MEEERTGAGINLQRELEDTMRAVEEMIREGTEEERAAEKGEGEPAEERSQTEGGEEETMHKEIKVDPQQETEEILKDLEEEAAKGDRLRRRQSQELERSRIKTAENTNPYKLMAHLQGDEPMRWTEETNRDRGTEETLYHTA
ncbi:hypothetical protein CYMTET_43996 [Cymbomonas tetramitiformis]|uniref:Uncharacterized protein n=1 Tax=Cymbomonas tetramitiformis TaxID=36881 RepID=A0AAE0C118_9CHLO|nr:hypothetical protein CYMTET_43996 [Cymbomonas tetramitiformis]